MTDQTTWSTYYVSIPADRRSSTITLDRDSDSDVLVTLNAYPGMLTVYPTAPAQPSAPITIRESGVPQTVAGLAIFLIMTPYQAILYTSIPDSLAASPIPPSSPAISTMSTRNEESISSSIVLPSSAISIRSENSISSITPSSTTTDTSDSSIGSGAIAGIAIGAVAVLALIVGGWYFWRRKKRRIQPPTTTLTEEELARREGDGDKTFLDANSTAGTTEAYQTQYQEMSGTGPTQELDRSHSYKYAIGGAHELRAEDQPGELPYNGMEEHGRANETEVVGRDDGDDGRNAETIPVPGANNPTSQVSPHVEAQRKREVEWLEMEETRMRQRREALLQQGGGQHT